MNLSKNFTLFEFLHAGSAAIWQDKAQFELTGYQLQCAFMLFQHTIQPIRDAINYIHKSENNNIEIPLKITSGYRCKSLNTHVNGAKNSYHMKAMAVDITCRFQHEQRNDLILEAIKLIQPPFTERISEFNSRKNPLWIHLALDQNNVIYKRLYAIKKDGDTIYLPD
jgi:zinc D-Ala-D-Ala carboxypeptidase